MTRAGNASGVRSPASPHLFAGQCAMRIRSWKSLSFSLFGQGVVSRGTNSWGVCGKPVQNPHLVLDSFPSTRLPMPPEAPAVENSASAFLSLGLKRLGLALPLEAQQRLLAYVTELLKWNEKVSLTAITDTQQVIDKHLLDSLSVIPELGNTTHLLDLGAGAGLPGIPLAVTLPSLRATLVDAVAKKVAFMKTGAVKAGVAQRVRAIHARAEGNPQKEGIPLVDLVISRAFMDIGPFLKLAQAYLQPHGRIVTMFGQSRTVEELTRAADEAGLQLETNRSFSLPLSGDPRGTATFRRST